MTYHLQMLWQDLWIHFKNMCFQLSSFVINHFILDVAGLLPEYAGIYPWNLLANKIDDVAGIL